MKIHSLPRVLALAVTLTVFGSACSGSPTDAATLSITTAGASASDAATASRATIAKREVVDELKQLIVAVESVPETELPATQKSSLLDQLTAPNSKQKTPSATAAADLLTNKIISRLVDQTLRHYNLSIDAEDTKAAEADIAQSLYNYSSPKVRQAAVADGARTSRLSRFLSDTTNKWYNDADVQAFYQSGKKDRFLSEACTAHILVADEALAKQLLAQIRGGATFESVAAASSIDASNKDTGGDLGCNAKGAFVPEFETAVAAAKDGDLIGPVKTQYGYHLIKITTAYNPRSLDDALKAEIAGLLAQPRGWLDYTLGRTKVTVSRQFGTWDTKQSKVVPPTGASSGATAKPAGAAGKSSGATGK